MARARAALPNSKTHALSLCCVARTSQFHRMWIAAVEHSAALVVDVRGNTGGCVSELLLEKLLKTRLLTTRPTHGARGHFPLHSHAGPVALLVDEDTSSDGEMLAFSLRESALELNSAAATDAGRTARLRVRIVGQRTWGGAVGISCDTVCVDGTIVAHPSFASLPMSGGDGCAAVIENVGVAPDVGVSIAPHDYAAGRDPQLDAAIAEAIAMIEGP